MFHVCSVGDILIFLTGEEDITACCAWLGERDDKEELWVVPCYSALPLEDLSLVFDPTPPKYKRKVSSLPQQHQLTLNTVRLLNSVCD